MEATLHDIVNALTAARAHAEILAEQFPDYEAALLRFVKGVARAQGELLNKIRPDIPYQ